MIKSSTHNIGYSIFWNFAPVTIAVVNFVIYLFIGNKVSSDFDVDPNINNILLFRVIISLIVLIFAILGITKSYRYWKILSIFGTIITLLVLLLSFFAYAIMIG